MSRGAWNAMFLMLASTLAALILAEAMLRWIFPVYGFVLGPHPRYLHTLIPGTRQLGIDDARPTHPFYSVRINSEGHRGPEESAETPQPRIVVYGDSFIDSRYVPAADSYTVRLQTRLSTELGQPLTVVNAGVAGYGPDQESLRLEDDLSHGRADLIVVAVFSGNDFGDLVRNKLFWPGPGGVTQAAEHVLGPEALRPFRDIPVLHLQRALRAMVGKLASWRRKIASREGPDDLNPTSTILKILDERRREYESFLVQRDPVISNLLSDGYDLDLSLHPSEPEARFKRDLMAAVLRRIRTLAAARETPLLFLFIPSPIDVSDGWPLAVDRATFPEYLQSSTTDFLEEQARALDVPCVNLFGPFHDAGGRSLFRPQVDQHWNKAGMDLAARLTSEKIHAAALLAGVPKAPVRQRPERAPS